MTNKNNAIHVRELDKKFTLGRPQEKYHTLRDAIVNFAKVKFVYFADMEPAMKSGFSLVSDINA